MEDVSLSSSSKGINADPAMIQQYINDILNPNSRDNALAELSRCREAVPDLAIQLWDAFGTCLIVLSYYFNGYVGVVAVLLQEVIGIYNLLSPPALTSQASTRVCNALALMQCLASHDATRPSFLQGMTHPLYQIAY